MSSTSSGLSSTSRIGGGAHGGAQGEEEGRALAGPAFGPDAAAVAGDHALHGGEADARALELGGVVQALEGAEELVGVGHVEARAVVADEEDGLAARAARRRPRCARAGLRA